MIEVRYFFFYARTNKKEEEMKMKRKRMGKAETNPIKKSFSFLITINRGELLQMPYPSKSMRDL